MYKLPIKDSLITTHADPDADGLSSSRAVAEHLKGLGKKAAIRLFGTIPSHLEWIVAKEQLVSSVPDWVEQIIVLDCGPEKNRLGWELPEELQVVNIDHHSSRFFEHNPKKKRYIKDRCSTASMLMLDFGIVSPVLLTGLYGDTFFLKRLMSECVMCFNKLKKTVDDEAAEKLLSSLRPSKDRRILDAIRDAKVRHCRNKFVIIELKDNEDPTVIAEITQTLHNYSESVCLIQPDGKARLRTRNPSVNVAKIAELFSGGGHAYAAGLDVSGGKASALKALVISLDIEPIVIDVEEVVEHAGEERRDVKDSGQDSQD